MLRVILDPEPQRRPPAQVEPALDDLVSSVLSLAWIVGPAAPRTVARVDPSPLRVRASPDSVEIALVLENRQAAAAPVALALSPLRARTGEVWAPRSDPRTVNLATREVRRIVLRLQSDTPPSLATYEGELRLLGVEGAVVPVVVEIQA